MRELLPIGYIPKASELSVEMRNYLFNDNINDNLANNASLSDIYNTNYTSICDKISKLNNDTIIIYVNTVQLQGIGISKL